MDLNDAERYAVAALFTLALHSTHVESGVDKNGNSLSESDIAWGCPSEELFDEQLLSQVPLKLPPDVLDIFWGWDCMAPAGLAPRLYAWLKIPRKAWPGLLRMPDLAGCAGSIEAVEAFVTLVRRYSAFLDPELAFTTGQASRLQQHFSMPAAVAVAEQEEQEQQPQSEKESQHAADPSASQAATSSDHSQQGLEHVPVAKAVQQEAAAGTRSASLPAAEAAAAAAAAASITAAAIAAEAGATDAAASSSTASVPHRPPQGAAGSGPSSTAAAAAPLPGSSSAADGGALQPAASVSFDELRDAVDMLPKEADEGSVVPAATFTPAQQYKHTTSHKAVLALYEVIGGCLASNTEHDMEPLFEMAAQEAETAAIAAAAAKGNKKALQHFKQQQQQASSSSSKPQPQQQLGDTAAAGGDPSDRPPAAWFPDDGSSTSTAAAADSKALAPAAAPASSSKQQEQQSQEQKQLQQQQLQGVASIQWYDARARVAVKRVAHWLRVPWPQVRAFEQMWSAQALSLDAVTAKPKYETNSRAVQYLKVGAAAVGGGALLAVTGGLAAPAIAAGLGAAVTLAHGGAAVAAAVTGFAGSTAGTAAVTGLFGAWGASVGGGSARTLYGEVTEFGFWDLSQSIYVDGKGPEQHTEEHTAAAADKAGDADAAAPADSTAAAAAAASLAAAAGNEAAAPAEQQQQQASSAATASSGKVQPPAVQQQGFLHRLFSAAPKPDTATGSSSSPQSSVGKAAGAAAAAGTAAAAAASSAGLSSSKSAATPAAGSPCASHVSSNPPSPLPSPLPSPMQRQQQQQASPSSKDSQQAGQHPSPRGPLHMFGWSRSAGDEEDEGPAPRVRSKAIKLRDSAFTTDSDEDAEDFYEEYLGSQASGPHTPRTQARSTTPSTQRQQQQQQQQQLSPGRQQEHNQQQQQQPQQGQELTAVEVKDDPLSSPAPCSNPQQGRTSSSGQSAPPEQQQEQAGREQEQELQQQGQAAAAPGSDKHPAGQQQQQPGEQDLALATAAAAAAAAGTAAAAAAASEKAGSSAAAPSSSGVLSGLFSRKQAPPPPVYVPLLPTPVNPKHKDETRMALTIAVNGCCIEKMEDYVEPWKHLPSSDCDRFALVWESACLKELGRAVGSFLAQQALTQVAQKSIQTFLYTGLVGALALPMTLSTAMRVAFGSKWLVALRRAQAAGKMLAMQLAQGCHGGRPVTLIGCSMGARLVFHCLLDLARLGLRGCVENVILLGAPLSCRPDRWCAARSVVAGRLINGYSVNDWTLGLLYRVHSSSSIWLQAAGMYKVEVPGIENVNLSRLISGHQDYLEVMDDILEVINLHDV